MRTGITQEQVNTAADALVAAGHKPTVEKVRAQLGTGSPNTVTRMLDSWRGTLAQRMQDVLRLPEVPSEVGQVFAEVWRLAVTQAESVVRAALTHDQNELLAAQSSLTQERKIWEIALAEAEANVTDTLAKLSHAELQLTERQGLLAHTDAQRLDLLQQRDRLQQQHDRLTEELGLVRTQRTTSESKAATERELASSHIRSVEDRASSEIDRTRQEIKELQRHLVVQQRGMEKTSQQHRDETTRLVAALHASERVAASHAGRADALQKQLDKLATTSTAGLAKPRPKRSTSTAASPSSKRTPRRSPRSPK